ncbi:MAG: hypothetical protein COA47_07920 [Robiginitomaculum sp.]|nr:MAG: hypothetical protein COA47_07920 [Robiginitomaculum sp.]
MGIITSLALFFIIWWLVLFVTLPLGVRGQWEDDATEKGTEPGAPIKANIGRKFLLTTLIALVVFAGVRLALAFGLLDQLIG